jgi:hypothetical protein
MVYTMAADYWYMCCAIANKILFRKICVSYSPWPAAIQLPLIFSYFLIHAFTIRPSNSQRAQ